MLHVGCTTAQVQTLDDDSCFRCLILFFLSFSLCSRSSLLVDFVSSLVVDFSCFIAAKQLSETKSEMPRVRSLLYFHDSPHPSISSCRLALLPSSVHSVVYTSSISSVSNVHPYTLPDTSRSLFLSFLFFPSLWLCLYGYPYTVTPVSFDIPVGFLRPAQSPHRELGKFVWYR